MSEQKPQEVYDYVPVLHGGDKALWEEMLIRLGKYYEQTNVEVKMGGS